MSKESQEPFVVELTKEFRFEAAHSLPNVYGGAQVRADAWAFVSVEVTIRGP